MYLSFPLYLTGQTDTGGPARVFVEPPPKPPPITFSPSPSPSPSQHTRTSRRVHNNPCSQQVHYGLGSTSASESPDMMDVSILLAVPVPGWMHSGHIRRHSYPFFSTPCQSFFFAHSHPLTRRDNANLRTWWSHKRNSALRLSTTVTLAPCRYLTSLYFFPQIGQHFSAHIFLQPWPSATIPVSFRTATMTTP